MQIVQADPMNLNYDYDFDSGLISLTFLVKDLSSKKEQDKALYLVEALAAEYDLDPEVTQEDLTKLLSDCKKAKKESFTVEILEDGVEFYIDED